MEMMYAPTKAENPRMREVGQTHQPRVVDQKTEKVQCLRYVLFSYNLIIFVSSSAASLKISVTVNVFLYSVYSFVGACCSALVFGWEWTEIS